MRAQVAAPLKFLMKKVGKRPAAQQAGEPVVNRAAVVHQATPKGRRAEGFPPFRGVQSCRRSR